MMKEGGDLFIAREAPKLAVYLVVPKQAIVLVRTVLAIVPEEEESFEFDIFQNTKHRIQNTKTKISKITPTTPITPNTK